MKSKKNTPVILIIIIGICAIIFSNLLANGNLPTFIKHVPPLDHDFPFLSQDLPTPEEIINIPEDVEKYLDTKMDIPRPEESVYLLEFDREWSYSMGEHEYIERTGYIDTYLYDDLYYCVSYEFNENEPERTVLRMDPAPGTRVREKSEISMVISAGPKLSLLPRVEELSEKAAIEKLEQAKLFSKVIYENSDTVKKGNVIKSSPEADTILERDSTVTLYVSEGPKKSVVPRVEGMSEESARLSLSEEKLKVTVNYEYSDTVEKGTVIKVYPKAGSVLEKNSAVTMYVSKGKYNIKSNGSHITYWSATNWNFDHPYIKDDKLFIKCMNVKFPNSIKWTSSTDIVCQASLDGSFSKVVSFSIPHTKQSWNAGEPQSMTLKIPLAGFNLKRPPTEIWVRFKAYENGSSATTWIKTKFSINWET